MTVLPVHSATRASGGKTQSAAPNAPAAPETKLGFSFEMSLPLSVRTE